MGTGTIPGTQTSLLLAIRVSVREKTAHCHSLLTRSSPDPLPYAAGGLQGAGAEMVAQVTLLHLLGACLGFVFQCLMC
jgi:hypothetical protein